MATQNFSDAEGTEHHAQRTSAQVKDKASDMAHQAQEKAGQFARQAQSQVRTQIAGQKDRATDQLGSLSAALHHASESLREDDQGAIAGYLDDAARQVERFSGYLRNHTVNELLAEAERYARREPAIFLGGAMLLGLFGARFFKSSSPNGGREEYRYYPPPQGERFAPERSFSEPSFEREEPGFRPSSRTETPAYSQVHGTAGAEMPDPDRTDSRTATYRPDFSEERRNR